MTQPQGQMKLLVATRFGGQHAAALRERLPDIEVLDAGEAALAGFDDVEVVIGGPNRKRFREVLAGVPRLRWFHTVSAGVENLVDELEGRDGVVLTNNSGAYDVPIAEFVLALAFAAAKRLPEHVRDQRERRWDDSGRHVELRGATMVVVGLGSIGGELARLAAGLGMRVIGVRRTGSAVPGTERVVTPDRLVEVAAEADYLAITAPLTPATRGLVSREVIAALPPHAWVINIARGAIADEAALLEAVRERRIGGAALDVFSQEPLPADSPWWGLDNVIVTPHHSSSSPRLRERTLALIEENVRRWRAGEPLLNVVDRSRRY